MSSNPAPKHISNHALISAVRLILWVASYAWGFALAFYALGSKALATWAGSPPSQTSLVDLWFAFALPLLLTSSIQAVILATVNPRRAGWMFAWSLIGTAGWGIGWTILYLAPTAWLYLLFGAVIFIMGTIQRMLATSATSQKLQAKLIRQVLMTGGITALVLLSMFLLGYLPAGFEQATLIPGALYGLLMADLIRKVTHEHPN